MSVLNTASPASFDELIRRDPLELSDQDIDAITSELRKQRAQFLTEEQKKATRPKTKKELPQGGLSIDDLQISL